MQGTAFSSGLVRVGQILHEVEGRSTSVMDLEELDSLLLGRPGSLVHLVLSSYALDVSSNQNVRLGRSQETAISDLILTQYIESQVIFRNQQGNVGMELWKGLDDVFEVLSVQPEVSSLLRGFSFFSLTGEGAGRYRSPASRRCHPCCKRHEVPVSSSQSLAEPDDPPSAPIC